MFCFIIRYCHFAGRFYTGVGQIVDDTVSEELNNDNGKTVQVRNI